MAYKEKEIQKVYWSVIEIAKELNIYSSKIRFWATEIDFLHTKRRYTERDRSIIHDIYRLRVAKATHTMKGVNEYINFKYRR